MMKQYKFWKRAASALLALALAAGMSACGGPSESQSGSGSGPAAANTGTNSYDKFLTVDVYSEQANYQGLQSGWFAKMVKDKFNMEFNIIAPNVAGGGDRLYQTRSAAGDLGDLVLMGAGSGRLEDCIKAGLLLDMTDYVKDQENLQRYPRALEMAKELSGTDRIYCIPSEVSDQPPTTPTEGLDLTYGPYLRWDVYEKIGKPEMKTLDDLLPVLKQMQDASPESDSGKKTYAFSLFKDWDGNIMCLGKQFGCMYGYDERGYYMQSADGSDLQDMLDKDSWYIKGLKLYFDANQMGLLDPDSSTQNYDTLSSKYKDGAVLFSPWPWLGQSAYNTLANKEAGKGFMFAPIADMKIYSVGCAAGKDYVATIGAKAEDPQRMVDFLDWLYSPEGNAIVQSPGIEGLQWEMNGDGQPQLTEFGLKANSNDPDLVMPDEYGGGSYTEGGSKLAFKPVLVADINPANGYTYSTTLWETTQKQDNTKLKQDWSSALGGVLNTMEYLEQNKMYEVAPGNSYVEPAPSTDIQNLRNQIKAEVVAASWKMVFAESEEEFWSILDSMKETVNGLGYDQLLEWDREVAEGFRQAREEALASMK